MDRPTPPVWIFEVCLVMNYAHFFSLSFFSWRGFLCLFVWCWYCFVMIPGFMASIETHTDEVGILDAGGRWKGCLNAKQITVRGKMI